VRYHGGKWVLAPWIVRHFPAHRIYVEPFGGGGSVLLRKPRSFGEVYNDLDGEVVNLFLVARDQGLELQRRLALTPFSRAEFDLSYKISSDAVEQARRTVVRAGMGFASNLTRPNRDGSPQRTGFRCNGWRSNTSAPRDWAGLPDSYAAIISRLQGVVIENRDAAKIILTQDAIDTLFYIDPPYVHSTRTADAGGTHRAYRHELNDQQHEDLAALLHQLKGMVVLSGYGCDLYKRLYRDWHRVEKSTYADGARARVEVLWLNPAAEMALQK
jgi:DNA adenine methylase